MCACELVKVDTCMRIRGDLYLFVVQYVHNNKEHDAGVLESPVHTFNDS